MATKAEELRQQGNACFKVGDYAGAEKYYTQAIIKDATNAAFFTNRSLVRLKMNMYEEVINDCLKALELVPTSLKAYTNLGLAQLALDRPGEALSSSTTAYRFAIEQRSPSVASIAATCMEAKKKRWEQMERRRIEREGTLLKEMTDIIERDADKQVDKILRRGLMGDTAGFEGSTVRVLEEEVRQEAREKVKTLEDVFGKAEAERCLRREVPDYLVDTITFNIMSDPVITKSGHSYDRATLLDHLRRSPTDPLTRQPLYEKDLVPNLALRAACELFLKDNGWAVDW